MLLYVIVVLKVIHYDREW